MTKIMENKKNIRKRITQLRNGLTELDVLRCSRAVIDRVFESDEYKNASAIYTYFETGKEVSTHAIIKKAWDDGKKVAVPLCIGKDMEFIRIESFDSLMPGFKGILEPFEGEVADDAEVLMIMPGLAFDSSFNRIGYGGGFYDRYINGHPDVKFTLMALCYDFQIVDEAIETLDHDVPVDVIVTPQKMLKRVM